jgi:hypothetical protein
MCDAAYDHAAIAWSFPGHEGWWSGRLGRAKRHEEAGEEDGGKGKLGGIHWRSFEM